jgi:hypothetical protein
VVDSDAENRGKQFKFILSIKLKRLATCAIEYPFVCQSFYVDIQFMKDGLSTLSFSFFFSFFPFYQNKYHAHPVFSGIRHHCDASSLHEFEASQLMERFSK